jgi:hypothetical protein
MANGGVQRRGVNESSTSERDSERGEEKAEADERERMRKCGGQWNERK